MTTAGRGADRIAPGHTRENVSRSSRWSVFAASGSSGRRSRSPAADRVPSSGRAGRSELSGKWSRSSTGREIQIEAQQPQQVTGERPRFRDFHHVLAAAASAGAEGAAGAISLVRVTRPPSWSMAMIGVSDDKSRRSSVSFRVCAAETMLRVKRM